jgi:hypothetical protein
MAERVQVSGNTLAINHPYEDSCSTSIGLTADTDQNCNNAGAVHIFTGNAYTGDSWTYQAYMKVCEPSKYHVEVSPLSMARPPHMYPSQNETLSSALQMLPMRRRPTPEPAIGSDRRSRSMVTLSLLRRFTRTNAGRTSSNVLSRRFVWTCMDFSERFHTSFTRVHKG